MQIQSVSTNQNPSFNALFVSQEAKALIESQKGGAEKLKKATQELINSKWDLTIKKSGDNIYPYFGDRRDCAVIPCRIMEDYVMVYSGDKYGDCEDDITDCLKFSSAERAREVYDKLSGYFMAKPENGGNSKSPLQRFEWAVYAMKAFTEAELVPQEYSPWAHYLQRDRYTPSVKQEENRKTIEASTQEVKTIPFAQRLKNAWNELRGKGY